MDWGYYKQNVTKDTNLFYVSCHLSSSCLVVFAFKIKDPKIQVSIILQIIQENISKRSKIDLFVR